MKVYICDDSIDELRKYADKIQTICDQNGIKLELALYESGRRMLFDMDDEEEPDLIYLDIYLPGENGIDIAEALREKRYQNEIVFLTMSEDFMLSGFDVEALHYIVKHKTAENKFEEIFLRAYEKSSERKQEVVSFSCAGDTCTVPVNDIKYFEVQRRVISVHYDDKEFEFYSTLEKVENMLCRKGFIRVHRSYIVSLKYIVHQTYEELTLEDGTKIPVGRAYLKQFRGIWQEYQCRKTA